MTDPDRAGAAGAPFDERLIEAHVPFIRSYLRKILRRDEIEDGVQTVVARALEGADKYRGEASPRVWLLGIARYVGYELARSRRRHPVVGDGGLEPRDQLEEQQSPAPSQEQLLGDRQDQALTLMALDGLALDDKLALLVTYVDNLPGPEAANILGVSFAAFRQRLSRARQALAREVKQLADSGQPVDPKVLSQWQPLLDPKIDPSKGPQED